MNREAGRLRVLKRELSRIGHELRALQCVASSIRWRLGGLEDPQTVSDVSVVRDAQGRLRR